MSIPIKIFSDGSILEFDTGKFDDWCIYLTRPDKTRYAPHDTEYFNFLSNLSKIYTGKTIYNDFITIYNSVSNKLNSEILDKISALSALYGNYSLDFDIWFTTIYAGMVAEENKIFTKLGKRVKRLGIHQILIEGISPIIASDFSRGKTWKVIDALCRERGF